MSSINTGCSCLLIIVFLLLSACNNPPSEYLPENDIYRSDFNQAEIDIVLDALYSFAKNHNLKVIEKDREQMQVLTQGTPAFSVFLYSENDPIFSVTNFGVGKIVSINARYYSRFEEGEIEQLRDMLLSRLENEATLDFKKVDLNTQIKGQ
jgi:hypothetical protein